MSDPLPELTPPPSIRSFEERVLSELREIRREVGEIREDVGDLRSMLGQDRLVSMTQHGHLSKLMLEMIERNA